jgi:cysteinyl-tRNA synthetase
MSANTYPKATDHIDDQIKMIQKIEKNGFTYKTTDGVYFDTFKLEEYGVLSGQKAEEKKAGARVDMKEKRNNTDFALWKLSDSESKRQMEWNSPWGKGFPGWHIECSAMSIKYLGQSFDIHTGGIDHVSVHHENELAQSMGANSVYHAQIWMHNEFLTVDNGKMSKSLGNLFTVKDLIDKKYDPIAFRYMVLGAHYRTKLNFTWEALEASENALFRLQDLVRDWDKPGVDTCKELEDEFMDAINNDLDTPKTLAIVWKLIDSDFSSSEKAGTLLKFNSILGLSLENYIAKPLSVSEEVNVLIKQRALVRKEKDWKKSDLIRNQIEKLGYLVEDMEDRQKLIEIRK